MSTNTDELIWSKIENSYNLHERDTEKKERETMKVQKENAADDDQMYGVSESYHIDRWEDDVIEKYSLFCTWTQP